MIVDIIEIQGGSHLKHRCQKTSKHNYAFSRSNEITNSSQCSRTQKYIVNGIGLCKMHAGELLLTNALEHNK